MAQNNNPIPFPRYHDTCIADGDTGVRQGKRWAIQSRNKEAIPESKRQAVQRSAELNVTLMSDEADFKRAEATSYHEANAPLSDIYIYFMELVAEEYENKQDIIYFTGCALYNYFHTHYGHHAIGISSKTIYDRRAIGRAVKLVGLVLREFYSWKPKIDNTPIVWHIMNTRTRHADFSRWIYYTHKKFSVTLISSKYVI